MAKKTEKQEVENVEIAKEIIPEKNGKEKIKQKIEDALNGKVIIDNNDLKEVLQYL